jgi:glycolate oxidase iron-sulfur subunit
MQHAIPLENLGAQGPAMAQAVDQCVHCGFCLSACPTYKVLGEEMDSPRGRIFLMKEALEGNLTADDVSPYVDRCLGCLACVTACPSGVAYGDLLTPYRSLSESERSRSPMERSTRMLVRETLPYPDRFRQAVRAGKIGRSLRRALPGALGAMIDLLPESLPEAKPLPDIYPAQGPRRARVALLAGCVQQVLSPEINWATLRVLALNGVEVVIPKAQGCCGSLSMHVGEDEQARSLARNNMATFPKDVDAVITNAAGCGSGMHEYSQLFAGSMYEVPARAFADKVLDISAFLADLGIEPPPPLAEPLTVAYHDACHLSHAQGIRSQPRTLLAAIPNLIVVEIPEGDLCCGSAGTYNLEQPELAAEIGERKARNIALTDAEAVVAGNIGCMVQIGKYTDAVGHPLPVLHTIELLDRAYGGPA